MSNINSTTQGECSVQSPRSTASDELPADYFQQIPNQLVNDLRARKLRFPDIAVYMVFAKHIGDNAHCWPSQATVSKLLGASKSTVERSIKRLRTHGYLTRDGYHPAGTKKTVLLIRVGNGKVVRTPAPPPPLKPEKPRLNPLPKLPVPSVSQPDVEISKQDLSASLRQTPVEEEYGDIF